MVASRRLSAALLPWSYETHPHDTISLRHPRRRSCHHAAGVPVPFVKRGCSWDFALSRPVHALIRPISSLSLLLLCLRHPHSPLLPRFLSLRSLSSFRSFFVALHASSASFSGYSGTPLSRRIPPDPPPPLPHPAAEFSPENHPADECPGNCTPLVSDVVVDQRALARLLRWMVDDRSLNFLVIPGNTVL